MEADQNLTETERPPQWFNVAVQKILNAWFDPKSFEQQPGFYERLGVKTFKRYMPTSGDLLYRLIWKRLGAPDLVSLKNESSLREMESFTKMCEVAHLVIFGLITANIGADLATNNITHAAFETGLNVVFNLYPVLVQRYNRARLYRVFRARASKSKIESKNIYRLFS